MILIDLSLLLLFLLAPLPLYQVSFYSEIGFKLTLFTDYFNEAGA